MTPEELDKIAELAVEKILLKLPEVVGNIIQNHVMLNKMNKEFYSQYPEFANNKALVVQVLEEIEGGDPSLSYEDILRKSVPKIQQRLGTMKDLDLTTARRPKQKKFDTTFVDESNGVL